MEPRESSSSQVIDISSVKCFKNKEFGLSNQFDISMVFEISVFEIAKFSCIYIIYVILTFSRGPLMYPSQRGSDLREDINTMVKFWRLLFTDKKYITLDRIIPLGGREP